MKNFITPQGQQTIRNFKYKGGSIAYSYNYIWSPFAQFLLKFTPIGWAPNSITLAGFLINVFGCLCLVMQGSLGDKVQDWTLLLFAFTVFTYQNLDNVDGKQARRTGNSTPLGMLFDHGCDAFGLIFLSLAVGRVIGLKQQQPYMFVGFIGVMFGFYFSVWCQYYSKGIMMLGSINAVDDGIPFIWMMALFTYFMGQQFWTKTIIKTGTLSINPQDMIVYGVLLSSILQIYSLLSLSKQNFTKNYAGALKDLIHVFMILAAIICIVQFSNMLEHHFYAVFFSLGMMFVRNIIYMQLCVTAQMKYNQFQMSTILFTLCYPIYIFVLKGLGFPQKLFIYGLLLIIVADFFYFTVNVIRQFAAVLKIRVFHINKVKNDK